MTKNFFFFRLAAGSIFILLALFELTQTAASQTIGTIVIDAPWIRTTPKNAKVAAGYLTITNTGKQTDALLSAQSAITEEVQIHEMAVKNGLMEMRALPAAGLEIKPGARVELKPGGLHIMFIGLKKPITPGTAADVVLKFARAGDIKIRFPVKPAEAGASHAH